jgi:hypothetical protein
MDPVGAKGWTPGRFQSTNARHHYVHDNDVWLRLANEDDGRLAILGLPNQENRRILPEDEVDQCADLDIVIRDDDSNGSSRVSRS